MRTRLSLTIALAALAMGLSPAASRAATPAQVDKAVDAGAKHLLSLQRPDGSWPYTGHEDGGTALAGLALLESGVKANDPAIQKAAKYCRERGPQCAHTYSLALLIFFFDRLGDKQDQPLISALGERLRNGQSQNGAWSYFCSSFQGGVAPLGGDNSNTQFAIMGLWVARRHGVDVTAALAKTDQFYRRTQSSDGGWQYVAQDSMPVMNASTGPMTCAGLLGLLVHFGSQGELRAVRKEDLKGAAKQAAPAAVEPLKDPAVQAALKRLEQHMSGANNPAAALGLATELYFLWSIERVGAAYGLNKIGAIDWYAVGCDRLLNKQAADGSWSDYSPEVGTSLALLFLKRANLASDLTRMVQAGEGGAALKAGRGLPEIGAATTAPKAGDKRTPPSFAGAALALRSPSELVSLLEGAKGEEQRKVLQELHDRKGGEATSALSQAIPVVDVSLRSTARDLLAARLQRMTAATLARYLADGDLEVKQAAVAAALVKKDKSLASPLIDLLENPNVPLADAAHDALVACTGQDFGRFVGADKAERFVAVKKWKAWRAKV